MKLVEQYVHKLNSKSLYNLSEQCDMMGKIKAGLIDQKYGGKVVCGVSSTP